MLGYSKETDNELCELHTRGSKMVPGEEREVRERKNGPLKILLFHQSNPFLHIKRLKKERKCGNENLAVRSVKKKTAQEVTSSNIARRDRHIK